MSSATDPDRAGPTAGLSRIGQIAVTARDLDRAVAFYRDVLRLPFLFRVPNLAFFDCAGTRLMLGEPEGEGEAGHASILYFDVADLPATYDALRARGVTFKDAPHLIARMPDHELWMAFFADSEGNTLALMSEVRPAAG
ncbi:MAG TPA: VOC family protein [Chloroflexota bacterium]|nr:VOC family protein [Chloroflexota bacterium]